MISACLKTPNTRSAEQTEIQTRKTGVNWFKERDHWAEHFWETSSNPSSHNPDWTTAALEFIEEHKDQPFLLLLLCCGPNKEWFKSMMEKELASGEASEKPLNLIDRKSVLERIQKAGLTEAEVGYLWMDDGLGLILDKLDELGIADNTIVVFVSDLDRRGRILIKTREPKSCLIRWPKSSS